MLNFLHQLLELFYIHKALCCTRAFLSQRLSHGRCSSSSSLPPNCSCTPVPDAIGLVQMLCHAGTEVPSSSGQCYPPTIHLQPGCRLLPLPKSWFPFPAFPDGASFPAAEETKNCPGWRVFYKEGSNHRRGCKPGDCKPALRGSCCVAELIAMPLNALSVLRVFVSWTDWSWAGSSSRLS